MKINTSYLISCVLIFLSSCASTQYNEPIELTQDEIASIRLESGKKLGATKVETCPDDQVYSNEKPCRITICKTNKAEVTGLNCKTYIPITDNYTYKKFKNSPENLNKNQLQGTKQLNESKYAKEIASAKAKYEKNKPKDLENFCSKADVTCYLDSKYYPLSKLSGTMTDVVSAKGRLELNSNGKVVTLEITIFN